MVSIAIDVNFCEMNHIAVAMVRCYYATIYTSMVFRLRQLFCYATNYSSNRSMKISIIVINPVRSHVQEWGTGFGLLQL